ncbi:6-phosphogluconate dehydrogenase [Klebsiella pneumoniae]|uniref:6-phosphogluconate dehydrogenase n=1 Tax=Klebsiella pneumoniae TaxID=573 RepID=A0A4P0YAK6_KLEPN|nr:6-phosphogluconate dehydrogenase [Klebsiella pneumoniae]
MSKQQIGVVGMAVMGRNLALTSKAVVIPSPFSTAPVKRPKKLLPKIQARSWFLTIQCKSLLNPSKHHAVSC